MNLQNDIDETLLNVYPNPVSEGQEINIEIELNENKVAVVYIYDFAGKLVFESETLTKGFGESMINKNIVIEEKGLYLVKVVTEDHNTHLKQSKVKKLYVI